MVKTAEIFNNINEFALIYLSKNPELSAICYNDELLLKGLLLNSERSLLDAVTNSNDTAVTTAYWYMKLYRDKISELQSSGLEDQNEILDSLETLANDQERKLVILSADFANTRKQFENTWEDVLENLSKNEAAI
ncbi:MAG: hypothetical protein KKD31_15385, partial [Bacteroidetes bacterium]|nr:hypothetical protein [Bacteroidota bacterium]